MGKMITVMKIGSRFSCIVFFVLSFFLSNGQVGALPVSNQCDNRYFLQIQKAYEFRYGRNKPEVPVHVCGQVITASYARRTRSGLHGYFYLDIGSGFSIRIVNNLEEMVAPPWPWVRRGDYVEVVGRYYYDNPRKQGVDWTHKDTGRKWPYAGYVIVNGIKYD